MDKLKHAALTTMEIIEETIPDKTSHYAEIRRKISGNIAPQFITSKQRQRQKQQVFYSLLSRLKKQGLVKKQKLNTQSLWKITNEGLKRLKFYSKLKNKLSAKIYRCSPSPNFNLVTFDVPEKFHQTRDQIRQQLSNLGFNMLHQSVWLGKYQLPEEFLYDLRELNMLRYIHILKVTKGGTIKEI